MSTRYELDRIERRQRLADERFRGEPESEDEVEQVSAGELVLGGAFIGLLVLAVVALVTEGGSTKGRRRH